MRWLVLLGLWLLPALAAAQQVQATLDRSQVRLGETVTLNITLQGSLAGATPDLGPLQRDFLVLGSSSNTSLSIVNGQRDLRHTFGVALQPRHVGHLVVPALQVGGGRTAPLHLEVVAAGGGASAPAGRDVFLEASVEPGSAWVGQEAVLTLRLFIAGNLANGALEEPHADGIETHRLGRDLDYQAERGGRGYRVVERRYALVPQRSGRLTVPPVAFQGQLLDPTDPDSFFNMGIPVAAASPAVTLEVRPVPAGWGSSSWLPARSLGLALAGWPADGTLRVGQPLQLTMTLKAEGLPYEALPELSLPDLDGASVYPDKPLTRTRDDGRWLTGERSQVFAVVPDRPGRLTFPAVTVKWWNVQTGRAETARIPARTLQVLPAAGSAAKGPAPAVPAPVHPAATPRAAPAPPPAGAAPAGSWSRTRWAVLLAAVLALALASGWLWRRRRGTRTQPPSARARRAAFMQAVRAGDPQAQAHALLAWARAERPGVPHLGALAEALASPRQREAIGALERRCYAAHDPGPGADLGGAFAGGFTWQAGADGGEPSPLPPLYPFKLR